MKGIIVAIVSTALCTAGVCFLASKSSPAVVAENLDERIAARLLAIAQEVDQIAHRQVAALASSATIDGTTEETFKTSIDAVKRGLSHPRQERFDQSMATLAGAVMLPPHRRADPIASMMAQSADPGAAGRLMRARVHGMTSGEVIVAGDTTAVEVKERGAKLDALMALVYSGREGALLNANESADANQSADANESTAIATLKNISSGQAQCQASGAIDANNNGYGEYGFFAELSGKVPVRGSTLTISPPVLSTAFGKITAQSTVARSGYLFMMFLPDVNQAGGIEAATVGGGPGTPAVDANQAETLWCCYAWPQVQGKSGNRAFFINQSGGVLGCSNTTTRYSGVGKGPAFTAALERGGTTMSAKVAANTLGNDGETWLVVK